MPKPLNLCAVIVIVGMVLLLLTVLRVPAPTRITGTPAPVIFIITVEQVLDSPGGWGVIHVYGGIPKNIHIVVNARSVDGIRVDKLGQAMAKVREYLGNDFHVNFSEYKDKTGRPYVLLMCRNEI